jgi:exodeoxyribonuclease-3
MRVATWNVNGLKARLDFLLLWLRERAPDVLGIQEIKLADEQFPNEAFEKAGYHALVHGQKAWNGVAILSRAPARLLQGGLPGQEAFGARLLSAEVEGIAFTTAYVPNGKHVGHADFPAKLAWLDALAAQLETTLDPARPAILCGDFNVCPAALDSWNETELRGSIFHTDEERARFARLLAPGLHDAFRERNPALQAFSWWDYRGGAFHRRQGLRIDFVLATPPLLDRVRAVEIDRDWRKKRDALIPSDHAPVWADLAPA